MHVCFLALTETPDIFSLSFSIALSLSPFLSLSLLLYLSLSLSFSLSLFTPSSLSPYLSLLDDLVELGHVGLLVCQPVVELPDVSLLPRHGGIQLSFACTHEPNSQLTSMIG